MCQEAELHGITDTMTVNECLSKVSDKLREYSVPDYDNDSFLLLWHVTGISRNDYFIKKDEEISDVYVQRLWELAERRIEREPLQHIIGSQNFYGYDFYVDADVLVPRQDTEILVENVIKKIMSDYKDTFPGTIMILDMCTGSGCIAISLYLELTKLGVKCDITASDISDKALEVANRNREALIGDSDSFHIVKSDVFESIERDNTFHIIVSNPPYIPTKDIEELQPEVRLHDPMIALDGDADGLKFYRRIIKESESYIKDSGCLFFEIGYNQASDVTELMEERSYRDIEVYKDLSGYDRVITGVHISEE